MYGAGYFNVNAHGHLEIGGRDTVELAETFGTPLYVMDENIIRENCRRFTKSIGEYYGGNGIAAHASKAFCCKEMCRLLNGENMGLDVVSAGELFTAVSAGFPMERVFFHGNNKTPEELAMAVRYGVGRIVVDNIFELELLQKIAESAGTRVKIQLRIKPGVEAHTHGFIKTGGIDSKFGFALETGEAFSAVKAAASMQNVALTGLHCHIGSQIFDIEPFTLAAQTMLGLMARANDELNLEIGELNLGGGFGIRYLPEDEPVPYEKYMEAVSAVVKRECGRLGLKMPFIIIEPGRSVTGPAGITLYKVGAVKEIPGIRTYVTVDGGMADNPRPGLYGARYEMLVANKAAKPKDKVYTVSGRCCETDMLGENVPLQDVKVGDTLAVLATGAYNYAMASNYNRLPKPAVVFVKDGAARVAVKRETLEDMARNDV